MSGPIETTAVSPSGLELLLAALDPDRERAGEKLLLLQLKLLKFFAWSRAPFPDELADETLDRVAGRLAEGETIRNPDPGAYVYGVARNVLRESWARPRLVQVPELTLSESSASAAQLAERRSRCLDRCLARLPEESRRLLLAYYQDEGAEKIAFRRRLAEQMATSGANLRLRLHRLRVELQGCVRTCLEKDRETEVLSTHLDSRMVAKR